MFFNIIVQKEDNKIVGVTVGFPVDESFLDDFYNPSFLNEEGKEETFENTTTDYYSMIEESFDLLQEFSDGKEFKYINEGIIGVEI
ncbi:MAG: hypothetical protein ISP01_07325 [Methanobrevibacter arboriphilus]|uniref:Uncharacterized protein n=1 Tax=Methanobrevibacter arboriphilus TaxID=39441 RepID=A0A843ADT3_METAZ|nr:hypothetical protein [Methanobrevibacter arboriphilus]MBF4469202.1 hypothetical protein [Methanobrevibacter arboriphilus]